MVAFPNRSAAASSQISARIPPPPPARSGGPTPGAATRVVAVNPLGMFRIDWDLIDSHPTEHEREVLERTLGKNFRYVLPRNKDTVEYDELPGAMNVWLQLHAMRKKVAEGKRFLTNREVSALESRWGVMGLDREPSGHELHTLVAEMDWDHGLWRRAAENGIDVRDIPRLSPEARKRAREDAHRKYDAWEGTDDWRYNYEPRASWIANSVGKAERDLLEAHIANLEARKKAIKARETREQKEVDAAIVLAFDALLPLIQQGDGSPSGARGTPARMTPAEAKTGIIALLNESVLTRAERGRLEKRLRAAGVTTNEMYPPPPTELPVEELRALEKELQGLSPADDRKRERLQLEKLTPHALHRPVAKLIDEMNATRIRRREPIWDFEVIALRERVGDPASTLRGVMVVFNDPQKRVRSQVRVFDSRGALLDSVVPTLALRSPPLGSRRPSKSAETAIRAFVDGIRRGDNAAKASAIALLNESVFANKAAKARIEKELRDAGLSLAEMYPIDAPDLSALEKSATIERLKKRPGEQRNVDLDRLTPRSLARKLENAVRSFERRYGGPVTCIALDIGADDGSAGGFYMRNKSGNSAYLDGMGRPLV
jgi:hypothetical protein